MLAGLVLVSAAVGALATGAMVGLSVPAWVALATYPLVCSLTLLLMAAVRNIRTTDRASVRHVQRAHG